MPGGRVLITRPAEDAEDLARRLAGHGFACILAPMLAIRFVDGPPLALAGVQALAATSANGVRAFVHRGPPAAPLPVFAVGDKTARVARSLGFARVESAAGDVEALAALIARRLDAAAGSILHGAAGEVAGDLAGRLAAAGFDCRREILYVAEPATRLDAAAAAALASGDLTHVLFFSPRTALTFVGLVSAAGLTDAARRLTACCLSRAVADRVAALPWGERRIAAEPTEAALLAAVLGEAAAARPDAGA
jgi:uroporphyrinogen-III synthase